jgi:DnaJ-class molecular chaperone
MCDCGYCPECLARKPSNPPSVTVEVYCPVCKGTGVMTDENGIVYDDVCPDCAGTGFDLQSVPASPGSQEMP